MAKSYVLVKKNKDESRILKLAFGIFKKEPAPKPSVDYVRKIRKNWRKRRSV